MNASQLLSAMLEYTTIKKQLTPVANGFGFEGLTITVKLRSGEQWELTEFEVHLDPEKTHVSVARGIGRHPPEKDANGEQRPARWFSVHFDHAEIAWVEMETFRV